MNQNTRISNLQLILLMIGFLFGDFVLLNPSKVVLQDAWLAIIFGWVGGFIIVGVYVYISLLNPGKTLIEILKLHFGRYLGSMVALFYLWYFVHLDAVIIRTASEYLIATNYPETPLYFLVILIGMIITYDVLHGLEVKARVTELTVPFMLFFIILIFVLVSSLYDPVNLLPILSKGIQPVIRTGYTITTFPFGEAIAFLMVFPFVNERKKILKSSYVAVAIVGFIFLSVTLKDVMVLSPELFARQVFPPQTTSSLIPGIIIEPLVSVNLIIASGIQTVILLYAASLALAQLLGLDDYKPLVIPIVSIVAPLSIWIYDDIAQLFRVSAEVYPYYAVPFQIIIPLILLIMSWIKSRKKERKTIKNS